MNSIQGSNGALWLNKGWVDALTPMLYLPTPEQLVFAWQDYALRVERPDRVWPLASFRTPAESMVPNYRAAIDKCHVRGYGLYTLSVATHEYVNSLTQNTVIFPGQAVPYWGEPKGK
jgi:hypothetical protein